jgi:hypothetical protein
MNNKAFVVFAIAVLLVGVALGHLLSWHPSVRPHKILLVIGCIYNLLAVIVLSEVFSSVKRHKEIALAYIAPAVLWVQMLVPLGATIGAVSAKYLFQAPGHEMALHFSSGVFVYSLIPLSIFDAMVVFPRLKLFANPESRWRYFGLFMIGSGVLLQLIAAIMDVGY